MSDRRLQPDDKVNRPEYTAAKRMTPRQMYRETMGLSENQVVRTFMGVPEDTLEVIKAKYLASLEQKFSLRLAAEAAGQSALFFRKLRERDPKFDLAVEEIRALHIDDLEDRMLDRAINGFDEPVFYRDQEIGTKTKFDPLLQIFMLKSNKREKYGDSVKVQQSPDEYAAKAREAMISILAVHGLQAPKQSDQPQRFGVWELPPSRDHEVIVQENSNDESK